MTSIWVQPAQSATILVNSRLAADGNTCIFSHRCRSHNFASRDRCYSCQADKPGVHTFVQKHFSCRLFVVSATADTEEEGVQCLLSDILMDKCSCPIHDTTHMMLRHCQTCAHIIDGHRHIAQEAAMAVVVAEAMVAAPAAAEDTQTRATAAVDHPTEEEAATAAAAAATV